MLIYNEHSQSNISKKTKQTLTAIGIRSGSREETRTYINPRITSEIMGDWLPQL